MSERTPDRRPSGPHIVAGIAGVVLLVSGAWAFSDPTSFFRSPARFPPFNPHFIRDIGAFQLGLGAVLVLAVWWRDALLVGLAGVSVGSVAHFVGHILDRDLGGDPVRDLVGLGLLAAALVAATMWRARELSR